MEQMQLAKARLFSAGSADSMQVVNLKLFPGTSREATAEDFANQINRSLSQIEAGEFEEVLLND